MEKNTYFCIPLIERAILESYKKKFILKKIK